MHEVKFGVWVRLSSVAIMEAVKTPGDLFKYRLIVRGADGETLCAPGFDSMEDATLAGHALARAASEEK